MKTILDHGQSSSGMVQVDLCGGHTADDFFRPIADQPDRFDWVTRVYMWKVYQAGHLAHVGRLPNLNDVTMSECQGLTGIDGLYGSRGIRRLRVSRTANRFSLRAVAENPIHFLDLSDSPLVDDIEVVRSFDLTHGYFYGCRSLRDLELFRGMSNLQDLYVSDMQNVNLEPLANHHSLRYLGLRNCGKVRNADVLLRLLRPERESLHVYVTDGSTVSRSAQRLFEQRRAYQPMRFNHWGRSSDDRRPIDKPPVYLIN